MVIARATTLCVKALVERSSRNVMMDRAQKTVLRYAK